MSRIGTVLAFPAQMRLSPALLLGCLAPWFTAAAVVAQNPAGAQSAAGAQKLVDSIEAPLLYMALSAGAQNGGAGAPQAPKAVQALLADPAFDTLFGSAGTQKDATGRALALVRGVLARSAGDLEIALTGVLPSALAGEKGQPLLVLRARLQPTESSRMQDLLAASASPAAGTPGSPPLAQPRRRIGEQQTYNLLGADGQVVAEPGRSVEVAVVGTDLVIANDATAMEELLVADSRTSAKRRVLSSDPRFQRLKEKVPTQPGSLLVYGDWLRLGQRLQIGAADAAVDGGPDAQEALAAGVPSFLVRWSGIGSARGVMVSLVGDDASFTGTVLLDFDHVVDAREARPHRDGPRPDGPRGDGTRGDGPRHEPFGRDEGIDGWLASMQSVAARTLLRDLPGGGLGGIVLAVDLQDIAQRSWRGGQLLRHLRKSFEEQGVDFDRKVMSRLGVRGTAQLLLRKGVDGAPAEITSVYAVRATNKKAADDLFDDLRRAAELNGLGRITPDRDRRLVAILELRPHEDSEPTMVAVHEDSVLVAFDTATIDDFVEAQKRAARNRQKRDTAIATVVQKIGGDNVAGLFDLDFAPWLDHFAGLLAERGIPVDLTGIPRRHTGYLDLQPRDGGLVLRVRVLSAR